MNKHLASEGSCVVLVTQTWTEVAVMPGTWGFSYCSILEVVF